MSSDDSSGNKSSGLRAALDAKLRGKAMPLGAMGRLEDLAKQIGIARHSDRPNLGKATLVVFAGDHGLTAEGIAAYPSAVTGEIAKLILAGAAGANVCARAAGVDVLLVDAGLLSPLDAHSLLVERRIASGTKNSRHEPAMTTNEFDKSFYVGREIAKNLANGGTGIFALGEVGIGNSSAASLVAHAVTAIPLDRLAGPGAGTPAKGMSHKLAVLSETFQRSPVRDGREALRQFGGFEMVMMAGAMLEAAHHGVVIVDGYIATAVAAAALAIEPFAKSAMIFAHASAEPGHAALLEFLAVRPLFDLGMRLGEGTGAVLAVPFVRAAAGLLNDLADLPGERPA